MNASLTPEERAKHLLNELSLDEKLSQLTGLWLTTKTPEHPEAFANGIGSVSTLFMRDVRTTAGCASMQRAAQEAIMAASPHQIPAIFHMEGLCGAYIQGATSFPAGIARGASFDVALEEAIGQAVAQQELAVGITHVFAPVLDIARDPRMGRFGEPYGEDPALCAAMGAALCRGIQAPEVDGRHADAVAKHFLGFHLGQGGIHGSHAEVSLRTLKEVYAKPFQAAITQGGLRGVMPCYCDLLGSPVHLSKVILSDLLRDEMGFEGVVVSDYEGINNAHNVQNCAETMGEAGYQALMAGVDQELPTPTGYAGELRQMFYEGKADVQYLDRAVLRVLTAKFRMGLFEHPFAMEDDDLQALYGQEEAAQLSRRSASESMVLLKNDGVLPLDAAPRRIAVIGCHAKNARAFFGGYTHLSMAEGSVAARNSMAGIGRADASDQPVPMVPGTQVQSDETPVFDEVLRWQKPGAKSLLDALILALPNAQVDYAYGYPVYGADESGYDEALALAQKADLVILTLGGKHGTSSVATMGEGVDATDIGLPPCQEKLLARLSELHKPMVGVHLDGRPLSSDVADRCLNAILEAWSPAEHGGEVIADVLTGKVAPSGHLPVSVPRNAGQIPVYYGHVNGSCWHQGRSVGFQEYVDMPHTPRYPFGFGLTYTDFRYDGLTLTPETVSPQGEVRVSFTVTNTGHRAAAAIPQLYVRDRYASVIRPERELAGFARVPLAPEESRQVTFVLRPSQLAFPDQSMAWKIEKGDYDVMIGASSADIRLEGSFRIAKDHFIDPQDRAFWATCEMRGEENHA